MNFLCSRYWAPNLRTLARISRPNRTVTSRLPRVLSEFRATTRSPTLLSIASVSRHYSEQAIPPTKSPEQPSVKPSPAANSKPLPAQDLGGEGVHITQAEQRKKDWRIIKLLLVNIWPPNDWGTRGRVLLGFGLLISGKVSSVHIPWPVILGFNHPLPTRI